MLWMKATSSSVFSLNADCRRSGHTSHLITRGDLDPLIDVMTVGTSGKMAAMRFAALRNDQDDEALFI
jgi:hypothetical protein